MILRSPQIIVLLLLLITLALLLMLRQRRSGPALSLARMIRAPLIRPRSPAHWCVNVLWWYVTARWAYLILQPLFDAEIRREYDAIQGGLATAWVLLLLLYLPYLIAYLWLVLYLDDRDRARGAILNPRLK